MTTRNQLPNLLRLLALTSLTIATGHAATQWHSIATESRLRFTARWETNPVPGYFKSFQVQLTTKQAIPQLLGVRVDTLSLRFDSPLIAHAARGKVWFDVHQFNQARFTSSQFVAVHPDGAYQALGTLFLKGAHQPISIFFHCIPVKPNQLELIGHAQVIRTKFGIGAGPWLTSSIIGKRVNIRFQVRLVHVH